MTVNAPDNDAIRRLSREGIYSRVPEITARLVETLPMLHTAGLVFEDARPIDYGSRLSLRYGDREIAATLYYSRKKGFSLVMGKNVPDAAADTLRRILLPDGGGATGLPAAEKALNHWIGTDEAGKGDFLGPLVTAAFRMTRDQAEILAGLGVRDSKALANGACREIARTLFFRFKNQFNVVELVPDTYNRLYGQFKSSGRNLNHLLGWSHGKAVEGVYVAGVDAVVIDQFARGAVVDQFVKQPLKRIIRPRAENNPAVAAASILARGRYLFRLEKLSEETGVPLVPGAGDAADAAARACVAKHGPEILTRISKRHFKNAEKLLQ